MVVYLQCKCQKKYFSLIHIKARSKPQWQETVPTFVLQSPLREKATGFAGEVTHSREYPTVPYQHAICYLKTVYNYQAF